MLKKVTLQVIAVAGALMTAIAGLSGVVAFLFGSGRPAFDDPTIIWFAPLFLTPLALVGVGLMAVSSLLSKQKRALFGWSCLALAVMLALTAAAFNLTGLSTGETALEGTLWGTAAITASVLYALAMLEMSFVGVVVVRGIHSMETEEEPNKLHGAAA